MFLFQQKTLASVVLRGFLIRPHTSNSRKTTRSFLPSELWPTNPSQILPNFVTNIAILSTFKIQSILDGERRGWWDVENIQIWICWRVQGANVNGACSGNINGDEIHWFKTKTGWWSFCRDFQLAQDFCLQMKILFLKTLDVTDWLYDRPDRVLSLIYLKYSSTQCNQCKQIFINIEKYSRCCRNNRICKRRARPVSKRSWSYFDNRKLKRLR